ncbi:MAG: mechanosensitive ion channel [Oscillospiraceae bacterium]|nr:mechanosensitive ion channel [Oscillospiraceae bacterium]
MEQGIANVKSLTGSLALDTIVSGLLTLIVCYIAIRIVKTVVAKALGKANKLDVPVKNLITKAVTFVLWALTIIIVAGAFGINSASLVALLSVVGLALSMSVQGLLSNFFSGILLLINRPFKEGDYIEAGDKAGTVKNIGFFNTTINSLDNVSMVVPNGDLTGATVKNYSREPLRRVDMTFNTSYDVSTADAKAAILDAIGKDARILSDPAPFVRLGEYKDSTVEYIVRVWCKNADYWDVHFDLNENVREAFAANGVAMSYQHVNVHVIDK